MEAARDADALFDAIDEFLDGPREPKRRRLVRPPPPPPEAELPLLPPLLPPPQSRPAKPAEGSDASEPLEPSEPSEPSDPSEPSEISEPSEASEQSEPSEPSDHSEPPASKSSSGSEPSESESSEGEPTSEPYPVPRLTIKPIAPVPALSQPPIEKMTIKINKTIEVEADDGRGPDASDSDDGAPKRTFTIEKPREIRQEQRFDERTEPLVPKLTIKISQDRESRASRSPERPPAPKITIRPIKRPAPDQREADENSDGFVDDLAASDPESVADERVPKLTIRTKAPLNSRPWPSDGGVVGDERAEAPRPSSRPAHVPERFDRPLQIETCSMRNTPERQGSGQESPRIILKINKTVQGPTSEILTDKREETEISRTVEPIVPKLTIKLSHENNADDSDEAYENCLENETRINSHVEPIKLKLSREGSTAKIVSAMANDLTESAKENANRTGKVCFKRTVAKEDTSGSFRKENNSVEPGNFKLDKLLANSNLTITKYSKPISELENLLTLRVDPGNDVSFSHLNSVDISEANKRHNARTPIVSKVTAKIHSASEYDDAVHSPKLKRVPIKRSKRISNYKKEKNAEMDWNASSAEINDELSTIRNQSPIFNKIEGDIVAINEGSSSQECMIIDDLSQDPLDIGNVAKAHFTSVNQSPQIPPMNNNIVNIVAQGAAESLVTPRRGRGRPRKNPIQKSDDALTPALVDERNLRKSRTPRITATTRTPRGRGRSRGSKRGLLHNSINHRNHSEFPEINNSNSFFPGSESPEAEMKENNGGSNITLSKSLRVRITNIQQPDDSDVQSVESDTSVAEPTSPSECLSDSITSRGRGRGRGNRGIRRPRGGRTPRTTRGTKTPRGNRQPKFYEEVQLQDAAPPVMTKHGGRNKIAANHTTLDIFEEETCMMGDNDTSLRTTILIDEESQDSEVSAVSPVSGKSKKSRMMDIFDDGKKVWTAADVVEYDWPPENCGTESPPQTVMIQEQVALYLGVKSFKRKYPDLNRRNLEPEEKTFLRERNLISEAMCELGVTAIDAGEVLDIMFTDFPDKYEEYRQHLRETRDTRSANKPPPNLATERSKQESLERAVESASSWNSRLNRQRRTMRSAAVDLQTLTLHWPRKPQVVTEVPAIISHYPIAVLPGQYTDFYKSYSSEELKYFPINTVINQIYSPVRVDEDSPSEESAEDSEGVESSSEASDSESSERNFRRRNLNPKSKRSLAAADLNLTATSRPTSPSIISGQSLMAPSPLPPPIEIPRCKLCNGTEHANRRYPSETFITCASCQKKVHPSCLEMAANVAKCVRQYAWQCPDCKCCARCEDLADDDKMLFCDLCDRGYHIYCVGLKRVPTGRWHCSHCAICRSCGSRTPSGLPNAPTTGNPNDQWHHHLKKNNSGQRVYSHTLCGPCARAWRAGRYCSLCERCFMGKKGALKVVICVNCDRTHHKECVKQPGRTLDVLNYMCNGCRRGNTPRRHAIPRKYKDRRRPSQPLTNNTVDSTQNSNQNSAQTEPLSSMDLSVDSICTNDSNHRSINVYDATFEESEMHKPLIETPVKGPCILSRRLATESEENNDTSKVNDMLRLSNNHIQKDLKTSNDCLNNKGSLLDLKSDILMAADSDNLPLSKIQNSTSPLLNNVESESSAFKNIKESNCVNSFNAKGIPKFLPLVSSCSENDSIHNETKLIDTSMDIDVQYGNNSENI